MTEQPTRLINQQRIGSFLLGSIIGEVAPAALLGQSLCFLEGPKKVALDPILATVPPIQNGDCILLGRSSLFHLRKSDSLLLAIVILRCPDLGLVRSILRLGEGELKMDGLRRNASNGKTSNVI